MPKVHCTFVHPTQGLNVLSVQEISVFSIIMRPLPAIRRPVLLQSSAQFLHAERESTDAAGTIDLRHLPFQ